MTVARPRVAVVYKSLPQYRKRFYELLHERLTAEGVEFLLVFGQPGSADAKKQDIVNGDWDWSVRINNRIIKIGHKELFWQPCLQHLRGADLVIVEQASKLLVNYVLLAQQLVGVRKVGFWGHGRNFQSTSASVVGEAVKRVISRLPHWWFAYNATSAKVVQEIGFPPERITVVQNAIDTRELRDARSRLSPDDLDKTRRSLGLRSKNVGIFCGALYKEKCLDFLLQACHEVRKQVPDFEIIFLGAGPEQHKIEAAARQHPWIHYVGPTFDAAKVPYFGLSKLFLMPGLVGLAILDAFALETPLVTTSVEFHSPEIEYLINGSNGVMTKHEVDAYAREVVTLLKDEQRRTRLQVGCRLAATRYSVEDMVERFAAGVLNALSG